MSKHTHQYIYIYLRKKGRPVQFRCQTLNIAINVIAWTIAVGVSLATIALIWSLS